MHDPMPNPNDYQLSCFGDDEYAFDMHKWRLRQIAKQDEERRKEEQNTQALANRRGGE